MTVRAQVGFRRFSALTLLALTTLVYFPGLPGDFAFDDYQSIVTNVHLDVPRLDPDALLDAALSAQHTGPLARPLAMLSFAANRSLAGPQPLSFKVVNIGLHGINAILLYLFLAQLLPVLAPRAPTGLAFALAALWAVHPIHLTSVLYVVQRMTALSATFVLVALVLYLDARLVQRAGAAVPRSRWLCVVSAGLGGLLCKETALCLPAYLLLLETLVLRTPRRAPPLRLALWLGIGLAVLLAAKAETLGAYLARAYASREFTLEERLWTETRVLWHYLQMILLPLPGSFTLFHDDLVLSRGALTPPSTAFAVLGLVGVTLAVLVPGTRRVLPWLTFGWLWFLAGHALEGSIVPLELMHEHRNYLPMLGPLVLLGMYVSTTETAPRQARLLCVALVIGCGAVTMQRAMWWRTPARQVAEELVRHPNSARLWYEFGRLTMAAAEGRPARQFAALTALERALRLAPIPTLPLEALLKLAIERRDATAVARLVPLIAGHPRETLALEVFRDLVECQGYRGCQADAEATRALLDALLARSDLSTVGRGRVLEWLAVWYARVLGDAPTGVVILADLAAASPYSASLAARLAEMQVAAGQLAAAHATATAALARLPWHAAFTARALRARLLAVTDANGDAR